MGPGPGTGTGMSVYFTDKTFRFLRQLARNNNKAWFEQHRKDYDGHLRQPFLRLIADLQPEIAAISPHYRADPRGNGGSLLRRHRDTRHSKDNTPYTTWAAATCFELRRQEE